MKMNDSTRKRVKKVTSEEIHSTLAHKQRNDADRMSNDDPLTESGKVEPFVDAHSLKCFGGVAAGCTQVVLGQEF